MPQYKKLASTLITTSLFLTISVSPASFGSTDAELVKDINSAFEDAPPAHFVQLGDFTYFTAGNALWKTDGTTAGTIKIREFLAFGQQSNPLGVAGNLLYISASEGDWRQGGVDTELWKYDPATNRTTLLKDIDTRSNSQGSDPRYFTAVGSEIFFTADTSLTPTTHLGRQLWRSDGTPEGTELVVDLFPNSDGGLVNVGGVEPLFAFDSDTLFFEGNNGTVGDEVFVWRRNPPQGTAQVTLLKNFTGDPNGSNPYGFTKLGTELIFAANVSSIGNELWVYDTAQPIVDAGNVNPRPLDLRTGSPASDPTDLEVLGGKLYFTADLGKGKDRELQEYTTGDSASKVGEISSFSTSDGPRYLTALGTSIYFNASDGINGFELWKYDGTTVTQVKNINPNINPSGDGNPLHPVQVGSSSNNFSFATNNGFLYFAADDGTGGVELWRSDGTVNNTNRVKDLYPGVTGSDPRSITPFGSNLLFVATDENLGTTLWLTNGSEAGTAVVKDINSPLSAFDSTQYIQTLGNNVFFRAFTPESGSELWVSDGTAAGTRLIKDIIPGSSSSSPEKFAVAGGMLFFAASDGSTGTELWRTDGTETGTVLVKDIEIGRNGSNPNDLTTFGSKVVFRAETGTNGEELWISDGTAAGTVMVKDIQPGRISSDVSQIRVLGEKVYFRANDGVTGSQLWVTDGIVNPDGTSPGTIRVSDINPLGGGSDLSEVTVLGGMVYFTASDGTGTEVWKSDGTRLGTALLKDINSAGSSGAYLLKAIGDKIFFNATGDSGGEELWVTNGTAAGTRMVKDINPTGNSSVRNLTDLNGLAIFQATDGTSNGTELWKSDGTEAGTVLIKDINPNGSSVPSSLFTAGINVYFYANDGLNGTELWKTDGTSVGTAQVADIWQGSSPSTLGASRADISGQYLARSKLAATSNSLFFIANNGVTGLELWKVGITAATSGETPVASSRPYEGPLNLQHVENTFCSGKTAELTGQRLNTIETVTVGDKQVKFELLPNGNLRYSLTDVAAGKYQVRLWVPNSSVNLTSEIFVVQCNRPASISNGRVNVGSFNGKLVVYAAGLEGKRISWKVGGRWGRAVANSSFARFDRPTPRKGVEVNVEVFVDGVSQLTKRVMTR